jgi:hypothetical protein
VRDVARAIRAGGPSAADFTVYSEARRDRHAKQRTASRTMAELMCSFGDEDAARRLRALPLLESDATASSSGVFYAVVEGVPRPVREPGLDPARR